MKILDIDIKSIMYLFLDKIHIYIYMGKNSHTLAFLKF